MSEALRPRDAAFSLVERFPPHMVFSVTDNHTNPDRPVTSLHLLAAEPNPFHAGPYVLNTPSGTKQHGFSIGQQIGDKLTDNTYGRDNSRLHDIWHLTFMTTLGWSPVMRRMLGLKRRSNELVDEIEDGGRAVLTEEAGVALFGNCTPAWHDAETRGKAVTNAAWHMRELTRPVLPAESPISVVEWARSIALGHAAMHRIVDTVGTYREGEDPIKHASVSTDLDKRELTIARTLPEQLATRLDARS